MIATPVRRSLASPALLVATAVGLSACGGVGGDDLPSGRPVPTRASDAPRASYRPPADRLLKPEQVRLYVAVLERAASTTGPEGGAPPPAEEAADAVAARESGANVEEYFWVRERVLEAEAAVATERLNADVAAMLERTLADLAARRETAVDEGSRTLLDEQASQFRSELERVRREARVPEPPHVRRNAELLAPHRARIGELQAELDRRLAPLRPAAASPGARPTATP